jgi:peptidoglycan/xylan/chitin deacetylase (PgdA/CDA1 family)
VLNELKSIRNSKGLPLKAGFFLIGKDKSGSRRGDIWSGRKRLRRFPCFPMLNDPLPSSSAADYPHIVRAIEEAGHCALVHSQCHKDLATCSLQEIETEVTGCYETLVGAGAKAGRYFRPPYLSMPAIPPDSRLIEEGWKMVLGISSGDTHPWATEESVVECCIRRIKRVPGRVVLIFHDFRGLPAYRFSIGRIVQELMGAGFLIEDFDPEAAAEPLSTQG